MRACERFFKVLEEQIDGLLANPTTLDDVPHETIYHHLLSKENGRSPPSRQSLLDEASVLLAAGSETVANTCVNGIFQVLSNPEIRARLVKEIEEVWPDKDVKIGIQTLEKLPYLVRNILPFAIS